VGTPRSRHRPSILSHTIVVWLLVQIKVLRLSVPVTYECREAVSARLYKIILLLMLDIQLNAALLELEEQRALYLDFLGE
jgi:hypothetical protein